MRQVETLESRMLLSASTLQVVMSPQTSYLLDKHGVLEVKATGNIYARVASVTKPGNVEVQLSDDTGASADLKGVSSVAILETGAGGQMVAWQTTGVNAAIFAQGPNDQIFVDDLGNDHTAVLVSGTGTTVNFDGSGYAEAFATGSPKKNNDMLIVNGSFKLATAGFQTVENNGAAASPSKLGHVFSHVHL
jgi:hypothetical protein